VHLTSLMGMVHGTYQTVQGSILCSEPYMKMQAIERRSCYINNRCALKTNEERHLYLGIDLVLQLFRHSRIKGKARLKKCSSRGFTVSQ
jgi:hypothetical protein